MSSDAMKVRDAAPSYIAEVNAETPDPRQGYRKTEIGVVPIDWEIRTLGPLATITSGESPSLFRFVSAGTPYFKVEQLNNSSKYLGNEETDYYINQDSKKVSAGSVLFPKRGASIMLNKIRLLKTDGYMDTNMMGLTPGADLDGEYLFYVLSHRGLASVADTASIPQINNKHIIPFRIPYPCKPEQRAIAEALSDVDELLGALEALIAKKGAIKQAAIQQLLTGKIHLPGFSGEWETKRLGDIAEFFKGGGLSKADLNDHGRTPCVHYGELFTVYGERIAEIVSRTDAVGLSFYSVANDVLMPTSDVTPNGLATASCVSRSGVALGGDILVIRSTTDVLCGEFLAYAIKVHRNQVMQLVTGTTVFHLYGRDMANFRFSAPSPQEQSAIASVLSDMDAEIAALEARRDKIRALKQAMMQELLTGRTRLL